MANEQNKGENIFTIYINNATGIIIEDINKKERSIFSNVYDSFFQSIGEILDSKESNSYVSSNNIFAFIGDRGSGKTSCMNSVAKMLEDNNENPICRNKQNTVSLKDKSFEVLKSTDPSFFAKTKNILDIVLGRLFSRFEEELKKNITNKIKEKNDVLQNFENVKHSLACMDKNVCDDDCVNQLIDLSASVDLKKYIGDLIESFLNYTGKDYLVIPVDDIDLHTFYAFDMAEQIRKYLVQPRTIILMALKIPQLEYAIERHYLDHYKEMLDKGFLSKSSITDMAIKYLIKFIPQSHRFPLKTVEELLNTPVEIKDNQTIIKKGSVLKDCITEEIYNKTRFLPYKHYKEPSLIIPRNLRECCYLLEFLSRMKPYSKESIGIYNHDKFVNYFINTWTGNLKSEDLTILTNIYYTLSVEQLNKSIIINLYEKLINYITGGEINNANSFTDMQRRRTAYSLSDNLPFAKITSKINSPYNISIGDLIVFLEFYETKIHQENEKAFIFAIKSLYSNRLSLFYDESKLSKDYSNQKYLIGGAFISESDSRIEKHFTKNNTYKCEQEIRRIISISDVRNKLYESIDSTHSEITDIKTFNTIEFFALTISRPYEFNNDEDFRTKPIPTYEEEIPQNNPYVWFDIFSLFYNVTQLEQCYNKISKDFYNIAKKNPNSILSQLNQFIDMGNSIAPQSFAAHLNIRSFDFLEKIRTSFITETTNEANALDTLKNILEIFKKIDTSSFEQDDYNINFEFVEIFINILSFSQNETSAFNTIYSKTTKATIEFISNIQKVIFRTMAPFVEIQDSASTIETRRLTAKLTNNINENVLNLKYSKSGILEQLDELGFDRPYSSTIFSACRNFIDWLKTLPVIA